MNFHALLLPKVQDWLKWLEDETESATIEGDKSRVKDLFEMALKDYPASNDIWFEYLNFCESNHSLITDLNTEYKKAAAFPAWNLQKGHLLFKNTPVSRAIPYTSKAKIEAGFDDVSLSPFESFEQNFPQNIEKYIETVQTAKFMNSTDKLTLCRVLFERAIEIEIGSSKIWEDYLKFLHSEMKVSSVILSVNYRLIRAHPLNVNFWILLLENLELFNRFDDFEKVFNETLPKILLKSSHKCFLALQMTRLDYLRRRGNKEELLVAFQTAIYDEEQQFSQGRKGEPVDPQGRLSRYFGQVLVSLGEIEKFRNVWQLLLKQHAKEAAFWLEYLQIEKALALNSKSNEIVSNGFKRAVAAVTDYPETIFYEWLQFEKQNGLSLQILLDARERVEKQRKILQEREQQRQQKEVNNSQSRKRTRVESDIETDTKSETKQPLKSFNPDATLFVNNLPFSFTEKDIESHFNKLISKLPEFDSEISQVKSIRMHMNSAGNSFKGHATIEFDSQKTAVALLENFNRQTADESGRPVFLDKYVSPLEQKKSPNPVTKKSESDAKTLYVSNLPTKESAKVEELFKSLSGIQQIRHVEGKQFAFIEFESENCAVEALKEIKIIDKSIKAAFSNPPTGKQQTLAAPTVSTTLLKPRSVVVKKQ